MKFVNIVPESSQMALINNNGPDGLGVDDVFYEYYNNDSDDSDDDEELGGEELSGGGLEYEDLTGGMLEDGEGELGEGGLEHEGLAGVVQDDEDSAAGKLGISKALAIANYLAAGTEVEEESDRITVNGNAELISPEVDAILDEIVVDLDLPYKPSDFQRVAVNCVGMQKNLVLVSPTGSGKMDVPLLSALVLRPETQQQ